MKCASRPDLSQKSRDSQNCRPGPAEPGRKWLTDLEMRAKMISPRPPMLVREQTAIGSRGGQWAMNETHPSLLCRAVSGEAAAWERIVNLYQPMIHAWLRRLSVPPQEAADLAQEVMAVVVKELPGFAHAGHPGSFRGWLRAITVNRVRAFLRRGRWRERALSGE